MSISNDVDEYDAACIIIGGGPASLILSYILHGNIPYYCGKHSDAVLHRKLVDLPSLLHISSSTHEHFSSSLRYSTQALPINTLLDTLIRPNADTEVNPKSHVKWIHRPEAAVKHVVLTEAKRSGGQWADSAVDAGCDVGTLSYSEMLSLPGYTYADHYHKTHGKPTPEFDRPSRIDAAMYYEAYPAAVGIADTILTSTAVSKVIRWKDGFEATLSRGQSLTSRQLVLGTGIHTHKISPPPMLFPLMGVEDDGSRPLLVIGSGFSAADAIISASPTRRIVHIFRWNPEEHPSPLKGCHHQAYPEYAAIYRLMKLAAMNSRSAGTPRPAPLSQRRRSSALDQRDWSTIYEGLPNASVDSVHMSTRHQATIHISTPNNKSLAREVGSLSFAVGRRGKLSYLSPSLQSEIFSSHPHFPLSSIEDSSIVSGRTLRHKAESSTEVAPDVFIIGSLTGDSLIRHAFGGCIVAAQGVSSSNARHGIPSPTTTPPSRASPSITAQSDSGVQHWDLHLDRREVVKLVQEFEDGG